MLEIQYVTKPVLHHVTNAGSPPCNEDWSSRLDDDDVASNLPLQLALRVDRRSCSSCTLSYDTPPNRDVFYTFAAGPRTTDRAVLDN